MKKFVLALAATFGLIGGAQAACVAAGLVVTTCAQSVAVSQGSSAQGSQNATAIFGFSAQGNQATNTGVAANASNATAVPVGTSSTNSTSVHANQSTGNSANLSLGLALGQAAQTSSGTSGAGGNAGAGSGLQLTIISLPTP